MNRHSPSSMMTYVKMRPCEPQDVIRKNWRASSTEPSESSRRPPFSLFFDPPLCSSVPEPFSPAVPLFSSPLTPFEELEPPFPFLVPQQQTYTWRVLFGDRMRERERSHMRSVISTVGRRLTNFRSTLEFVTALWDAIRGTSSLPQAPSCSMFFAVDSLHVGSQHTSSLGKRASSSIAMSASGTF